MMKKAILGIGIVLVLLLCVSAVAGYSVSNVNINPSGALTPGTTVTVSYTLVFPVVSGSTFPSTDTLRMQSDLDTPVYSMQQTITTSDGDKVNTPFPDASGQMAGKSVDIDGWLLSYPDKDLSIGITMTGKVPSVDKTSNKTLIKISDLDSYGTATGTPYTREIVVVNTAEVASLISARQNDLQSFRSAIDEKAAMDVDTSEAETQYNTASNAITQAKARSSSQYDLAENDLVTAQNAITQGTTALDKAWAQKSVDDSQVPINNVDAVIAEMKRNYSAKSTDADLSAILAEREAAATYVSAAQDMVDQAQYDLARNKATEAFDKGNQSYTDALALLAEKKKGLFNFKLPSLGGSTFIIIGVIAVVLIVVGVIIYRKRSRWDELG